MKFLKSYGTNIVEHMKVGGYKQQVIKLKCDYFLTNSELQLEATAELKVFFAKLGASAGVSEQDVVISLGHSLGWKASFVVDPEAVSYSIFSHFSDEPILVSDRFR